MKTINLLLSLVSISSSAVILLACTRAPANNMNASSRTPDVVINERTSSPMNQASSSKGADFSQALADYNAKNYEKAISDFQDVIKNDPQNPMAHYYLGKSYQGLKKDDDAIPAFTEAIRIKPDLAEASYSLGSIYYSRKDYQASLPFFEQAAKINQLIAETERFIELAQERRAALITAAVTGQLNVREVA